MITKDKFLEIFPFFHNSSEALILDILSFSRYEFIPTQTIVQFEGQPCYSFGLMLSGENRIYKVSDSGREITLYEIGSGEFCILNASGILSNKPCPATAESLTTVEMLVLPAEDFRRLFAKYEEMRTFVFTFLNQSLTSALELIVEIAFQKMDERLIDYLIEKSGGGRLRITHQKIANDLGTAREVVSRLLKDFERKGLISRKRNYIHLLNL